MSRMELQTLVEPTAKEILDLIESKFGSGDPEFMFDKVMGAVLKSAFCNRNDLSQNRIDWSVNNAVAAQVGPQVERMLKLHAWMIRRGYGYMKGEWDLGYADRHAVAVADERDFKSFAAQTQNYTYMVALVRRDRYLGDSKVEAWEMHLRVATTSRYSREYMRAHLDPIAMDWFASRAKTFESPYFRYKDCRDQGYLLSLKPAIFGEEGWTCEHAMLDWHLLQNVIYDISSLVDSIEEDEPALETVVEEELPEGIDSEGGSCD